MTGGGGEGGRGEGEEEEGEGGRGEREGEGDGERGGVRCTESVTVSSFSVQPSQLLGAGEGVRVQGELGGTCN